jgi:hypothetical protein
LGATGVRCQVFVSPNTWNGGSQTYVVGGLFVKAGTPTANVYGGCYMGGTNPDIITLSNAGEWQTLDFQPSGGSWSTDEANVTAIGIDVNMHDSSNGQATQSDIIIDNVQVY